MGAPHVTLEKIRFADTDLLGHVNNAVYATLLEAGRVEIFVHAGLLTPATGFAVVIARLELDFLREMSWPAEVRVETAVHGFGAKSFQLRQRIASGERLTARAHSVLAMIDVTTRRSVPITDAWKAALEPWLVPEF